MALTDAPFNNEVAYSNVIAITPGDTTDININGFMVTDDTSGNAVAITCWSGAAITLHCIKGVIYPIRPKYIMSTNTTADTIVGLI